MSYARGTDARDSQRARRRPRSTPVTPTGERAGRSRQRTTAGEAPRAKGAQAGVLTFLGVFYQGRITFSRGVAQFPRVVRNRTKQCMSNGLCILQYLSRACPHTAKCMV